MKTALPEGLQDKPKGQNPRVFEFVLLRQESADRAKAHPRWRTKARPDKENPRLTGVKNTIWNVRNGTDGLQV